MTMNMADQSRLSAAARISEVTKTRRFGAGGSQWVSITVTVEASQLRTLDRSTLDMIEVARDSWLEGTPERLMEAQRLCGEANHPLTISVRGQEGIALTPAQARKRALDYWISYFEESPGDIAAMRERFGGTYRSARGAAKFVIEHDGQYHGLDVHETIGTGKSERVLILESMGGIGPNIERTFPEVVALEGYSGGSGVAGAPDQERALKAWSKGRGRVPDYYGAACAHLAELGILESEHDGDIFVLGTGIRNALGYRYGTGWVYPTIPLNVLNAARAIEPDYDAD